MFSRRLKESAPHAKKQPHSQPQPSKKLPQILRPFLQSRFKKQSSEESQSLSNSERIHNDDELDASPRKIPSKASQLRASTGNSRTRTTSSEEELALALVLAMEVKKNSSKRKKHKNRHSINILSGVASPSPSPSPKSSSPRRKSEGDTFLRRGKRPSRLGEDPSGVLLLHASFRVQHNEQEQVIGEGASDEPSSQKNVFRLLEDKKARRASVKNHRQFLVSTPDPPQQQLLVIPSTTTAAPLFLSPPFLERDMEAKEEEYEYEYEYEVIETEDLQSDTAAANRSKNPGFVHDDDNELDELRHLLFETQQELEKERQINENYATSEIPRLEQERMDLDIVHAAEMEKVRALSLLKKPNGNLLQSAETKKTSKKDHGESDTTSLQLQLNTVLVEQADVLEQLTTLEIEKRNMEEKISTLQVSNQNFQEQITKLESMASQAEQEKEESLLAQQQQEKVVKELRSELEACAAYALEVSEQQKELIENQSLVEELQHQLKEKEQITQSLVLQVEHLETDRYKIEKNKSSSSNEDSTPLSSPSSKRRTSKSKKRLSSKQSPDLDVDHVADSAHERIQEDELQRETERSCKQQAEEMDTRGRKEYKILTKKLVKIEATMEAHIVAYGKKARDSAKYQIWVKKRNEYIASLETYDEWAEKLERRQQTQEETLPTNTVADDSIASSTAPEKESSMGTAPKRVSGLQKFQKKVSRVIMIKRCFGAVNFDFLAEGEKKADSCSYMRSGLNGTLGMSVSSLDTSAVFVYEDNEPCYMTQCNSTGLELTPEEKARGPGRVRFTPEHPVYEIEDLTKRACSWGDVWGDLYFEEEELGEMRYSAFMEECGMETEEDC